MARPATDQDRRVLRLHPDDDVVIVLSALAPGDAVDLGEATVAIVEDLPVGFKMAARDLARGARVRRYGMPIGTLTADVAAGRMVHEHNLTSDYLVRDRAAAGTAAPRAEREDST